MPAFVPHSIATELRSAPVAITPVPDPVSVTPGAARNVPSPSKNQEKLAQFENLF